VVIFDTETRARRATLKSNLGLSAVALGFVGEARVLFGHYHFEFWMWRLPVRRALLTSHGARRRRARFHFRPGTLAFEHYAKGFWTVLRFADGRTERAPFMPWRSIQQVSGSWAWPRRAITLRVECFPA